MSLRAKRGSPQEGDDNSYTATTSVTASNARQSPKQATTTRILQPQVSLRAKRGSPPNRRRYLIHCHPRAIKREARNITHAEKRKCFTRSDEKMCLCRSSFFKKKRPEKAPEKYRRTFREEEKPTLKQQSDRQLSDCAHLVEFRR